MILQHAVSFSHKPAIIAEEQQISCYGYLQEKIFSAAAELSGKGVLRGDRVILAASNSPSFIYGYFGAHLIGAIVVPVDPNTPDSRLRYIIDQVDPKAIFTVRPFQHDSISVRSINDLENLPNRKTGYKIPDLLDVADILFTTGTTGDPKGVVLTHGNIFHAASNINAFIKNTSEDREVVPLPLSHSFGLGRLRCNMLAGGTIILAQGFTFPGVIFQAIERWKATGLSFVPAGWAILLRLDGEKIGDYSSHLKYIEIGSAPMPLEHKKLLIRLLPKTRICMHYGLTEASRSTFLEFHESKDKITSIGKATPNVEIKIVGENNGDLPPFHCGKIMVRGGTVKDIFICMDGKRT
jgi:long-chain acyl-CoA synthetase